MKKDALLKLIDARAFACVLQPIVDLQRGVIIAFEALTRLPPNTPFQHIGEVFDTASEHGLLWELEEATRWSSLVAASGWPHQTLLFLNSTPTVFTDERFEEAFLRDVESIEGLSPERLVLEITERAETTDDLTLLQRVHRLKSEGFRIAVDDVGAGTSGLNRIMALRPQWLKLDRELISHIDADPFKQNLVDFFINFAQHSGVRLIVEGIEREQELRTLIDLGATTGQGFFLGRPGSRIETIDLEVTAAIQRRSDEANHRRRFAGDTSTASQFMREVVCIDGEETIRAAVNQIAESLLTPGVMVMDGPHALGWLPRRSLLNQAKSPTALEMPLKRCVLPLRGVIDPSTSLSDALRQLACREDTRDADPLIVIENGAAQGVLTLEDLFLATARMVHDASARANSITGLPIRSQCDRAFLAAVDSNTRYDAAFIDILGFHQINETIGYETGDMVLRVLAGVLSLTAGVDDKSDIVGHLGDDRFMILQSAPGLRAALTRIVEEFELAMARFTEDDLSITPLSCSLFENTSSFGLCLVLIENATALASLPSELMSLVAQARSGAARQCLGSNSVLCLKALPADLRKSA